MHYNIKAKTRNELCGLSEKGAKNISIAKSFSIIRNSFQCFKKKCPILLY